MPDASTIPAPWYVDARIAELEAKTVFSNTWQMVGRVEQVEKPGQFVTATVAGEPIVVVRGNDGVLRGVLQRLPASCRRGGHRALRAGFHPALSLSRLELRAGWFSKGHAGV